MRPVLAQHLVHLAKYCPGFLARAPGCVPLRAPPTTVVTARRCFAHAALSGTHRHTSQSQSGGWFAESSAASFTVAACACQPAVSLPWAVSTAFVSHSRRWSLGFSR